METAQGGRQTAQVVADCVRLKGCVHTEHRRNQEGQALPPGEYRISAESFFGGQQRPAGVAVLDQVQSVSISRNGDVTLNLSSGQSMRVNEVQEFF